MKINVLFVILLLLIGIFLFSFLGKPQWINIETLDNMNGYQKIDVGNAPVMSNLLDAVNNYNPRNQPSYDKGGEVWDNRKNFATPIPTITHPQNGIDFIPTSYGPPITQNNLNPDVVKNLGRKFGSIINEFTQGIQEGQQEQQKGVINSNTSSINTKSYDNYNHYSGNSLPTMYYSPDGATIQLIEKNGSYSLIGKELNGPPIVYLHDESVAGQRDVPFAKTFRSESGETANVSQSVDGSFGAMNVDNNMVTRWYTTQPETTQNTDTINQSGYGTVTDMNQTVPPTVESIKTPSDSDDFYSGDDYVDSPGIGSFDPYLPTPTSYIVATNKPSPTVAKYLATTPPISTTRPASSTTTPPISTTTPPIYTNGPTPTVGNYLITTPPSSTTNTTPAFTTSTTYTTTPMLTGTPYPSKENQLSANQQVFNPDLYMLKSQMVPMMNPVGSQYYDNDIMPTPGIDNMQYMQNNSCEKKKEYPPCPPCARCPEPNFECKKVPRYNAMDDSEKPMPVLNNFSSFGL